MSYAGSGGKILAGVLFGANQEIYHQVYPAKAKGFRGASIKDYYTGLASQPLLCLKSRHPTPVVYQIPRVSSNGH